VVLREIYFKVTGSHIPAYYDVSHNWAGATRQNVGENKHSAHEQPHDFSGGLLVPSTNHRIRLNLSNIKYMERQL